MPRPPTCRYRSGKNRRRSPPGQRKSPLLLTEGGTAQAVTGVEGTRYDIRTARKYDRPHIRHGLRPMTPCSSGMTATGSHGYFYSLRGAQPQGEGFSLKPLPPTPNDRTLPQSALAGRQPPLRGGQGTVRNCKPLPPLIRHGLRPVPPSPRGRRISEGPAHLASSRRTPPPAPSVPPPPTRREAAHRRFLRMKSERIGACRRPYNATPEVHFVLRRAYLNPPAGNSGRPPPGPGPGANAACFPLWRLRCFPAEAFAESSHAPPRCPPDGPGPPGKTAGTGG